MPITIPIEIGDTILTGRFKNHKAVVKEISEDENGLPLINGKGILKIRIEKLMKPKKQIKEGLIGKRVKCLKGQNKGMIGTVTDDYGEYIYVDFPDRAHKGKNTEVSLKFSDVEFLKENMINEGGRPNIPIDVKIKKEDNRFWIQLKEDDTIVGSPQGYETKEMAELACAQRGFCLNDDEPELPKNMEVPKASKMEPIKFQKPKEWTSESVKGLIKEILLETQNLPLYSNQKSIISQQTSKRTTSRRGTFLKEIKDLIREQLKKKNLKENSLELDDEIQEYASLSDKIDKMKAELEQMENRFETLDQKFRLLLETMAKELDETSKVYIRAKNILITIKKQGYDRTNKSYKDAYEFIRKKVNPKLQQMMDEVLETSKTITYVKSKLGVQYESKINENWISDLFSKVKNFFVNGIKKLRNLNQSVNQDLNQLETML